MSEKKGGLRYNDSKLRWRNFPLFLLRPVVEVGDAAEKREGNPTGKYPTLNFLKGLKVTDTLDSLQRHLDLLLDPNESDIDPEDGKHHLAKIAWNALVALHYIDTEWDDRELRHQGYTEKDVEEFLEQNSELMNSLQELEKLNKDVSTPEEDKAFMLRETYTGK